MPVLVRAGAFVDNVTRRRFENHAEFEPLYGYPTNIAEMDIPRVKSARQLSASIRRRIEARAAEFNVTAAA